MILFVIFCLKFLSFYLAAAENSIALKYPFLVRIYFKHATEEDSHCGGVIVDKDLVLTSAQCCTVVGDAYVVYGDTNHTDYVNGKNMDRYHEWGVAGKMLHDGYQELPDGAHIHDVCLMKLNRELPDDDGHRIIELPSERLSMVTDCIVPGWGSILNNTIQHVLEVETVFPKECQDGSSLCVKLEANCRGDGGNPIVCEDSAGRRIVYGVDSYYLYAAGSDMTCDDIETNYFVNLYQEKDFLDRHVRSASHSLVVNSGHGRGKGIGELAEIAPARGGGYVEHSTVGLPRGGRETEKLKGITTDRGVEELEVSTATLSGTWLETEKTAGRGVDDPEITTVTLVEGMQSKDRETGKWTEVTTVRGVDGLELTTVVLSGGERETEKVGQSAGITTDRNTGDQELSTVGLPGMGEDKEKETGKWTEMTTVKNVDELDVSTVILSGGGRGTEKEAGTWTEKTTARGVDELGMSTVTLPDDGKDEDRKTGTWAESTSVRISEDLGLSTVILTEGGHETVKVLGKWTGMTTDGGVREVEASTVTLSVGEKDKEIGKWTEMTTVKNVDELEIGTVTLAGSGKDKETGKWTEMITERGTDDLGLSTAENVDDFTGKEQGRVTEDGSNKATEKISETSFPMETDQGKTVGLLTTTNGGEEVMKQQTGGITEKGQEQLTHGEELIKSTEPGEYRTTAGGHKISDDEVESGTSEEPGGLTGKDWSETRLTTVKTEEKATENLGKDIYEKGTDEPFDRATTGNTEGVLSETITNAVGKETEGVPEDGSAEVSIKPEAGDKGEETEQTLFVTRQTTKLYLTEDGGYGGDSRGTDSHTGRTKMVHGEGTEKSFSGTVEPSVHGTTDDYEQASTHGGGREFEEGTNVVLQATTRKGLPPGTEEVPDVKSTLIGSGPGRTTSKVEGVEKEKAPPQGSDVSAHGEYETTVEIEAKGTESVMSEYDEGSGQFSGEGSGNAPEGDSSRTTEKPWYKITGKEDEEGTETKGDNDENSGEESGEEWKKTTVRAKTSRKPGIPSEQETTAREKGTEDWQETVEGATEFESQKPDKESGKKLKTKLPGVVQGGTTEESGDESGVGGVEETETGSEHGLAVEEQREDEYGSGEGSGAGPEEGPFEGTEMEVSRATVKGREQVTESTHQVPEAHVKQIHTKRPGDKPEHQFTATTRREWKGSTFISQEGDTENVPDEYDEDFDNSYSEGPGSTRKPFSRGSTGRKWGTTAARVKGQGTEKITEGYDSDIDHLDTETPGGVQNIHSRGTTRKKWRITTAKVKGKGTEGVPEEYDEGVDESFTEGFGSTHKLPSRGTTRKKWRITTAKVKGDGTESIPVEYDGDHEESYTDESGSTQRLYPKGTTKRKWRITTAKVKGDGTEEIPVEYDEDIDQSYTEGYGSTGNVHSRTTRKKWRITTAKVKGKGTEGVPEEYDEGVDESFTEGFGSTHKLPSRGTTRKKWRITTAKVKGDGTEEIPVEYDEDIDHSYTEGYDSTGNVHSRTTRKKWRITTDKVKGKGTEGVPEEYDEGVDESYTEGSGSTQRVYSRGTTKKKWRITTAKAEGEEEEHVSDEYDVNNMESTWGKSKHTTPVGKSPKKPKRPPVHQKTTIRSHGKEHGSGTESEAGSTISGGEYGSGGFDGDSGGGGGHEGEALQTRIEAGTEGITAKTGEHGLPGSGAKTKGKQTKAPSGIGTPSMISLKPKFHKAHWNDSWILHSSESHPKGISGTPAHVTKGKSTSPPAIHQGLPPSTHSPGEEFSRISFGADAKKKGPPRSPSARARAMIRYEQYYDDESPLTRYSGAPQFSPNLFIIFIASALFLIA